MLTLIGALVGELYCTYAIVFRRRQVVGRYGRLSLYWWVVIVILSGALAGLAADIALLNMLLGSG